MQDRRWHFDNWPRRHWAWSRWRSQSKPESLLDRCRECNIKLNKSKFIFKCQVDGLKPEPSKVKAILNLKKPDDVAAVQRLMGMFKYLSKDFPWWPSSDMWTSEAPNTQGCAMVLGKGTRQSLWWNQECSHLCSSSCVSSPGFHLEKTKRLQRLLPCRQQYDVSIKSICIRQKHIKAPVQMIHRLTGDHYHTYCSSFITISTSIFNHWTDHMDCRLMLLVSCLLNPCIRLLFLKQTVNHMPCWHSYFAKVRKPAVLTKTYNQ